MLFVAKNLKEMTIKAKIQRTVCTYVLDIFHTINSIIILSIMKVANKEVQYLELLRLEYDGAPS